MGPDFYLQYLSDTYPQLILRHSSHISLVSSDFQSASGEQLDHHIDLTIWLRDWYNLQVGITHDRSRFLPSSSGYIVYLAKAGLCMIMGLRLRSDMTGTIGTANHQHFMCWLTGFFLLIFVRTSSLYVCVI